jgi:hypothetical protein
MPLEFAAIHAFILMVTFHRPEAPG